MKAIARVELRSPRHPLLQRLRRALSRGELTPDGYCAIEGEHLVEEALRSRLEMAALVAARSAEARLARFEAAANGRLRSYLIPDRVFRSLAQTETPQGLAALVRLPAPRLEDCLARPGVVVTVLVGLQDPGNLGSILRALEAFGGAALLLAPNTVSPFNSKAVRASAGSLFRVPVFRRLPLEKIISLCRQHHLFTLGLAPRASRLVSELDLRAPVAFFVGGEGAGLPIGVVEELEAVARLPLAPPVESLNAAMAASLALYEMARQRIFPCSHGPV
ncbi:MAG: TrmH family RNA methyltransferase [Terriglobia bacterium]